VKSVSSAVKQGETVKVKVLEIDPKSRRISLSIKRANEAKVAESAAPTTPAKPKSKRKEPLKGGLDWNW
jgi:ribosomal protein S1